MAFAFAAVFALCFAVFFAWYATPIWRGPSPISVAEAQTLFESAGASTAMARSMAMSLLPNDDDTGSSFVMLNLVKHRQLADYGARPDLRPSGVTTGAEADMFYGATFVPKILKRACHPVYISKEVAKLPIMFPVGTEPAANANANANANGNGIANPSANASANADGDGSAVSTAKAAFSDWDYFALVRYRSMRDLMEAVAEVIGELGSESMMVLKHSGVERTYVIPVYSNACEWVLSALLLLVSIVVWITAGRRRQNGELQ